MLLQIHDELIFETPKEDVKRISKIIIEEMSSVVKSDQHSHFHTIDCRFEFR